MSSSRRRREEIAAAADEPPPPPQSLSAAIQAAPGDLQPRPNAHPPEHEPVTTSVTIPTPPKPPRRSARRPKRLPPSPTPPAPAPTPPAPAPTPLALASPVHRPAKWWASPEFHTISERNKGKCGTESFHNYGGDGHACTDRLAPYGEEMVERHG
eukprot:XP_008666674.1 alpha carbonic anhydrase 8-like [Zea mays]